MKFDLTAVTSTRAEVQQEIQLDMELEPHPNPRFMSKFKRYEPLVKDSTAIKALKTCPRMYFYQVVLGRVSIDNAIVLTWGSTYHIFREILEKTYGIGKDMPPKFDEEKARNAFATASIAALEYWNKHAIEQPIGAKYDFMTMGRLIKTLKVTYEHWTTEKKQGRIIVIASEQAFDLEIKDGTRIGGKADQLVRWNGHLWGRDFKTTTKDINFYMRSLEPNDQFTRYTLADTMLSGEQVQGQIVEVMYNARPTKTDNKGPKIIPLTTTRSPRQLEVFEEEQRVLNRTLKIYREEDIWPMHEASCSFCPYHSVCSSATEEAQMAKLEQNYTVRPWNFKNIDGENK